VGGATQLNQAPYNYTWLGPKEDTPPYGYFSHSIADVNSSKTYLAGGITALDALTVNYRTVGLIANFPNSTPGVQFSPNFRVTGRMVPAIPYTTWPEPFDYPTATTHVDDVPFYHSGTSYLYFTGAEQHKYNSTLLPLGSTNNFMNIYYNALGDINSSYAPESRALKAMSQVGLVFDREKHVSKGEVIEIPIRVSSSVHLGALTMGLTYRNDLIEVVGSNYGSDFIRIDHAGGDVMIGWYNTDGLMLSDDDVVAVLKVRVLADLSAGMNLFELDGTTELADVNAQVIRGVDLKSTTLITGAEGIGEITATNYPNPFSGSTVISYSLPESGKVRLAVYNKLGQEVAVLIDESQEAGVHTVQLSGASLNPGVYHYRIVLTGSSDTHTATRSMIVVD